MQTDKRENMKAAIVLILIILGAYLSANFILEGLITLSGYIKL